MIVAHTKVRVRYAETDQMGIVYHGVYLTWFEVGRIILLDEIGLPYRELENAGYRLPVLEANLKYLKPAYFDDIIKIETLIKNRPSARIKIEYHLFRKDELICSGYTGHAFITDKGRATRPPLTFVEKTSHHFN
ncbi:MAG: acyl-CoA thioester hydrolase [Rhodospirillaceae bacterium]|uniref:Esterase n=1 Tax=Candidatus Moanibacter tarae TaxID=2200854 RepID=A0A2Z4ALB5_9BACT|nr:MAG: Putative esterase [Candidatus Moanabacter tarae]MBH66945.1 acyl-CoA thioester hydrolase [Rhodospirillaceae bacterium]|tara:strand:+ start:5366 stop:5767 length:402 start_codon:yes stop_codon:yes gene_type:complete